ncbi:alkaline phosphatase family protein [Sphingomonas desiccabilis]|uniref:Alkaline phosphatase family protein n=1 Tax=Sphingomonas desiccabilis TaxID=429134 RepID=A0A4V1QP28_9SPHN|nr:ectonucleotide pyrophosphatase/phosphodiesterase [Sphingomonas desiccabilis]MBB3911530.1 putative AlkP superfamily pyrophosphatase or phosphodiesterase [Sphingomonas desiccabilis]RXZ31714.1 alkaline phosphatase family protein [Sphingomonas desiccabilis]
MFKPVFAAFLALASLTACTQTLPATDTVAGTAPAEARAPVTILVSIDGFRPDYLGRGVTPVLSRLAAGGVTGPMHPSFPSKTFPNHWTLVTGVRPDRHGIVANRMEDPADPKNVFTMATDDPSWWNGAEPIWVAAEQAGIRTATQFWPGSNVPIGATRSPEWPHETHGGTRPSDWQQYNEAISPTQRVQGVLDWLRRPAAIRPRLLTLYFEAVDTAGHRFGPDSQEVNEAAAGVDAAVGALVDGLAAIGQPANLVIVADHGMAATSSERVVALDKLADPSLYHVVEAGPYAALTPTPGKEAAVERALLKPHAHMECWRKAEIPARFHYGRNPRVPAILCLAEDGWQVLPTAPAKPQTGGNHGFDNMAPDMTALFIAHGPAFANGRTLPDFDNVAVYPLLRDLIGLPPAEGVDGTDAPFRGVLKAQ